MIFGAVYNFSSKILTKHEKEPQATLASAGLGWGERLMSVLIAIWIKFATLIGVVLNHPEMSHKSKFRLKIMVYMVYIISKNF
jgi:hypothetical protein